MQSRPSSSATRADHVLCALFLAAICGPCIDELIRPPEARSVIRENRNPAPQPEFALNSNSLAVFPPQFEAYYNDCFGLRDFLLCWHNALDLFVFGVEPTNSLVAGKNGWLFFREDQSVEVFRGTLPFNSGELESWQRALEARRDWLRQYGCEYLFVIVPNKEQIYPELVPDRLNRVGPTRLDQLAAHLREYSDVSFLDLRDALRSERASDAPGDYVYHPLGTHWTSRGAWAASVAILAELQRRFPAVEPYPRERYSTHLVQGRVEDSWAPVLYMDDLLPQPFFQFTFDGQARARTLFLSETSDKSCSEVDDPALPRVVLLHDSFGPWILRFLAEQCSRLTTSWQYTLSKELVWSEKPQVVIQMYTERSLMWRIPELTMEAQAIDAGTFLSQSATILDWNALEAPRAIEPYQGTKIALALEPEPAALAIDVDESKGMVLFPSFEVPPGTRPMIHVDVESPVSTVIEIWYRTADNEEYLRRNRFQAPVPAGRSDLYLKFPVQDVRGRLLVRIGALPGTYRLRRIEVRAAREP